MIDNRKDLLSCLGVGKTHIFLASAGTDPSLWVGSGIRSAPCDSTFSLDQELPHVLLKTDHWNAGDHEKGHSNFKPLFSSCLPIFHNHSEPSTQGVGTFPLATPPDHRVGGGSEAPNTNPIYHRPHMRGGREHVKGHQTSNFSSVKGQFP